LPAFDFGQRFRDVWGTATSLLPADDLFVEEFFSLSPLTSPDSTPDSTPNSTPKKIAVDLPGVDATPATDSRDLTPLEKKKQRMKASSKRNKRLKRFHQREEKVDGNQFRDGPAVRERAKEKYQGGADLLFTTTNAAKSRVTKSAYTAMKTAGWEGCEEEYELNDLVGEDSKFKFALKKWDGR
jgi:hypothetical protein